MHLRWVDIWGRQPRQPAALHSIRQRVQRLLVRVQLQSKFTGQDVVGRKVRAEVAHRALDPELISCDCMPARRQSRHVVLPANTILRDSAST